MFKKEDLEDLYHVKLPVNKKTTKKLQKKKKNANKRNSQDPSLLTEVLSPSS